MHATESNDRARATKYATVLDEFAGARIKVPQVADRVKKLGGVEAAYKQIVATERRRSPASAGGATEEEPPIYQQQEMRASRKGDAKIRGEQMEVEAGSHSVRDMETALGGSRPTLSIDFNRFLFVELEAAELKRVLDAGTKAKAPVHLGLEITVYPRKAGGLPRVVGDRVSSIEPTRNPWAGKRRSTWAPA